jgi:Lar family restriction alleviation protein
MAELKPCPFCGYNKLKIDRKRKRAGYTGLDDIVYYDTYSVRCPKCFARGGVVGGRVLAGILYVDRIPEWATTAEELKARAAEAWNRRVENDT